VRFSVRVREHAALDCNCSICKMKAFLHLIVPQADFVLESGAETLASYAFNTGVAKHRFCRICGVHPFYTPRSHPNDVDVNVRCLDGDVLGRFTVRPFDGARWEQSVAEIRPEGR
jgi:hypothetical protein